MAFHYLGTRADKGGQVLRLDATLRWSLKWWLDRVEGAKPRIEPFGRQSRPVFLFTDGACEPASNNRLGFVASYGAVLFDLMDNSLEAFVRS